MMKTFEFPPEQEAARARARTLAKRSIVAISLTGLLLYAVTGQSQTMKTAWITDVLSIVPSIAMLAAMKRELKPASRRFAFGHYRTIAVCFLLTAVSLLSMGLFLLIDAVLKLIHQQRPVIGGITIFGNVIWLGWPMIVALAISLVVGMYAGKAKQPVAKTLASKALEADSATHRNEYMSEGAGILGLILVAFGYWWGDAAAAAIISVQIVHEGYSNLKQVIADLMDESPTVLGTTELEPLPDTVKQAVERALWVQSAMVRLREHGHLITGEIYVVPRNDEGLIKKIEELIADLKNIDWRLHALTIMPVRTLDHSQRP
jgi:cation diffusion facilitator family transporter